MKKSAVLWLLALLLTLLLAAYQRLSGPTYPVRGKLSLSGIELRFKFPRSWTSLEPLPVRVSASGGGIRLFLLHRRYPLIEGEDWSALAMAYKDGGFQASIPGRPAAGKVVYRVEARIGSGSAWLNDGVPVVARFKGKVPVWLLIAHVLAMFAGMLLAFRTGLGALLHDDRWQRLLPFVLGVTAVGGLVLGPLVQRHAFGAFWSGFPLGHDLTDTKILFAVLLWLAAHGLRHRSRWWTVLATMLMVAVYAIPHSVLGSELNYQTGKIETAKSF